MSWFSDTWDSWTSNPLEALWNATAGNMGDATNNLATAVGKTGIPGSKVAQNALQTFAAPSWSDIQRPGQAFYNKFNQAAENLPEQVEPYAPAIATTALGVVNPFLGAAFNTAYQGGQMQANQKGMDWGSLGKDAAINFGTAAVADWAKNASAAKANTAARNATVNPSYANETVAGNTMSQGLQASQAAPVSTLGNSALASFDAANAAGNVRAGITGADMARDTANAAINAAPSAVTMRSTDAAPINQFQSSGGFMDKLKTSATEAAPKLANDALTQTLSPQANQPISGIGDNITGSLGTGGSNTQYGDIFKAFGDPSMLYQDAAGNWQIDQAAADRGQQAISANDWLQKAAVRDTSLPAGQWRAPENTPYDRQLGNIDASTQKYMGDFNAELQAAGKTKAIQQANPWMTQDQLMSYANDPSQLPPEMQSVFANFQPIFY